MSTPKIVDKPLIEMRNISREINASNNKTKTLLSNISWSLSRSSRVAVLSNSPVSSQAFLECASGVTPTQKGSIAIHGNISWPIGMRGGLLPNLSGKHNASFLQQIYGDSVFRSREMDFIQSLADISDELFNKPIKCYSKVIRERFYIALGLAFEFDAYIIPKSYIWKSEGLNDRQLDFHKVLRQRTEGKPLIMTGNDHDFMQEYCDEGILLENGEITFSGTFQDCRNRFNETDKSEQLQEELLIDQDESNNKASSYDEFNDTDLNDDIW